MQQSKQQGQQFGILMLREPKQRDILLSRIEDLQESLRLLRIRYMATKNTFENELVKKEGIKTRKKLNRLIGQYKIKIKGETQDDLTKKAVDSLF
ncbi:MAG: hypothetical protein BWY55_00958 [archaeon ADurb.Bin336]|jgi:hypothetical protein|nr:MAG: hypothetical protein BWY55_00958 [archaeon ADurb.Bin336]